MLSQANQVSKFGIRLHLQFQKSKLMYLLNVVCFKIKFRYLIIWRRRSWSRVSAAPLVLGIEWILFLHFCDWLWPGSEHIFDCTTWVHEFHEPRHLRRCTPDCPSPRCGVETVSGCTIYWQIRQEMGLHHFNEGLSWHTSYSLIPVVSELSELLDGTACGPRAETD